LVEVGAVHIASTNPVWAIGVVLSVEKGASKRLNIEQA
jgi:hypothetical protein